MHLRPLFKTYKAKYVCLLLRDPHDNRFLLDAGADPNIKNAAGERPGDSFDSVFVPESGDLESAGDDGQDTGPREAIMQMLDASRSLLDADRRAQVG